MLKAISTIAAAALVFCSMLYLWWRLALILHEWREKLYGDKCRLITLFTYRGKSDGR